MVRTLAELFSDAGNRQPVKQENALRYWYEQHPGDTMATSRQHEEVVGEPSGRRQRSVDRPESEAPTADRTILTLDGATKHYGPEVAVDELSLSVVDGEFITLLGPSGCGKSTTLRLIAGLERPDEGVVRIEGETAAEAGGGAFIPPENRDVGHGRTDSSPSVITSQLTICGRRYGRPTTNQSRSQSMSYTMRWPTTGRFGWTTPGCSSDRSS
jgi:hypothetical protein